MDGIRILLIIVGAGIILFNIIIQFANLAKIIQYTYATNSLGDYWKYFFKNNFSGRAIISSIIGLAIAIILFFILMPFVLYRKYVLKNDVNSQLKTGQLFNYEESYPFINPEGVFHTNIDFLNIKDFKVMTTGKIQIDVLSIIANLSEYGEAHNKKIEYKVMEKVKLSNKSTATVPLMLKINDRDYPTYIIYNQDHEDKYKDIKKLLFQSGYRDCIYFSIEKMS